MSRRGERLRDATLHLSTNHGTNVGGNKWRIPLGANGLHGKNVSKAYPVHVMVPNVFPNVRAPYNTFTVENVTTPGGVITVTIPEQFYSGTELAAAINVELVALGLTDLTVTFVNITAVQTQFRITNASATETYSITMSTVDTIGRVLGLPTTASIQGQFLIVPLEVVNMGEPNLAGVRLVHIKSEKLGHSMGMHSVDRTTHDMCVSVPFHDVVYGGVAHWAPADKDSSMLDMAFDICLANGVDISLWDEDMLPLDLPENLPIEMQFKIIHGMTAL